MSALCWILYLLGSYLVIVYDNFALEISGVYMIAAGGYIFAKINMCGGEK